MENERELESHIPQWIQMWAKFIVKSSLNSSELTETSKKLIEQILLATTQGDSCLPLPNDFDTALLGLKQDAQLVQHQVAPFVYDDEYVYLYRYWQLEYRLAAQIQRLKQQQIVPVQTHDYAHLLTDPYQKAALNMVAAQAFNIITGGPGTGKTYTLARIIAVLNQAIPNIRIAMAAPTGKAAQRMKEALQASLNDENLNAMDLISDRLKHQDTLTIHRLLGLGTQSQPRFHLKQSLPYDVIVIDEASMLDLNLATLFFEAVPDQCRVILLGDANQLASVDVGSVLADLQQVDCLHNNRVNLVNSRRFNDDAQIGKMAHFIQTQFSQDLSEILTQFETSIVKADVLKPIQLHAKMEDVIQLEYLPAVLSASDLTAYYDKLSWGYRDYFEALQYYKANESTEADMSLVLSAFDRYRILTAIRYGDFGLEAINYQMQNALQSTLNIQSQGDWYLGRPVMMTYNDYQLGLSNGDIGLCLYSRSQKGQFEVFFPSLNKWVPATRLPKSIQTAFALTIHKSQGSEFQHTAVVLDEFATKLLSKELIYTAITRAKSAVSLLVSPTALAQSFKVQTTRISGLVKKFNE